jgi:hypothetical protein
LALGAFRGALSVLDGVGDGDSVGSGTVRDLGLDTSPSSLIHRRIDGGANLAHPRC